MLETKAEKDFLRVLCDLCGSIIFFFLLSFPILCALGALRERLFFVFFVRFVPPRLRVMPLLSGSTPNYPIAS
jgi:hypothetical protein